MTRRMKKREENRADAFPGMILPDDRGLHVARARARDLRQEIEIWSLPFRRTCVRDCDCPSAALAAKPADRRRRHGALIKSFRRPLGETPTHVRRGRIRHCDHYGIVGTSSPRDGRRWHCRYSVPGMQMAPRRMVICRLIRPAGRKLPGTILVPVRNERERERVCVFE